MCFAKIDITFASPKSFFSPEIDNAFLALAVARALNSYTLQPDSKRKAENVSPYEYAPSIAQLQSFPAHSRAFLKPLKFVLNSLNFPLTKQAMVSL